MPPALSSRLSTSSIPAYASALPPSFQGSSPSLPSVPRAATLEKRSTTATGASSSSSSTAAIFPMDKGYRRVQSAADLPAADFTVNPSQMKSKMLKAVKEGEYSMVWALLGKGADPNDCDDGTSGQGWSPLHWSAKEGNLALCQLLVSRGADVNIRDRSGQSPLHRAAYWGRFPIVDFLVYVGANPKMVDHSGQTAAEIAFHRGNHEVFEYLSQVKKATTRKVTTWNVKKQFEQLLKDQAKEDKLLKKNEKLEEKMSRLTKELHKYYMLRSELEKRERSLPKSEQLRILKLEEKVERAKEEHRKNTIDISVARSESFERYASENKAQTWMSFIEEL